MSDGNRKKASDKVWTPPEGPTSLKLTTAAVEIKTRLQRGMSNDDIEVITTCCNVILTEAQLVYQFERTIPVSVDMATCARCTKTH